MFFLLKFTGNNQQRINYSLHIFFLRFLPETRDKSIAELDEMFKKKGSKNASTAKQSRGQGNPAFDL